VLEVERPKRRYFGGHTDLLTLPAVSIDYAATLLVGGEDDPERSRSEPSFASPCGTAPIPASSDKVVRHRLNRDANGALRMIHMARMKESRTKAYVPRRTTEGKTKREITRCPKRISQGRSTAFWCRALLRCLCRPGPSLGAASARPLPLTLTIGPSVSSHRP
jgi:transposase